MSLAITVHTAGPACMQCTMTKRHLARRGLPFNEVQLQTDDPDKAAWLLGFTQAPIVTVNSPDGHQSWDGYRPDRIDALVGLTAERNCS